MSAPGKPLRTAVETIKRRVGPCGSLRRWPCGDKTSDQNISELTKKLRCSRMCTQFLSSAHWYGPGECQNTKAPQNSDHTISGCMSMSYIHLVLETQNCAISLREVRGSALKNTMGQSLQTSSGGAPSISSRCWVM